VLKLWEFETNSMAEQGGIWTFTRKVDLPVIVRGSSLSPSSDQVNQVFCTLFMPGKLQCLVNVDKLISRNAATVQLSMQQLHPVPFF
jgi:hypothetical protein